MPPKKTQEQTLENQHSKYFRFYGDGYQDLSQPPAKKPVWGKTTYGVCERPDSGSQNGVDA